MSEEVERANLTAASLLGEANMFKRQRAEEELLQSQRPSTEYPPKLSIDGDMWCALYGENLQDGVAGFGRSPREALADFDEQWVKNLEPKDDNG